MPGLPEGYVLRPPTREDASAVASVIAACQAANGSVALSTAEEVLRDWQGMNLAEEAIVAVSTDGRVVACADLVNRSYVQVDVYGYVHPSERGRGIGTAIVNWGERWAVERIDRAPSDARVIAMHYVNVTNKDACNLLAANGYADARHTYVMAITLNEAPPPPVWPVGIEPRQFVRGRDERQAFEALEEASRDIWGRPPGTFERFLTMTMTNASSFDASLWHLATADGDIAGLTLTEAISGRGWIGFLGVRRAWRKRGLGLALLRHAFGAFYVRGIRDVRLSVDAASKTGASRLYARAGMAVVEEYARYQKELRPGIDISNRAE
jgi:GNAT superfamily N-acetyltransferase